MNSNFHRHTKLSSFSQIKKKKKKTRNRNQAPTEKVMGPALHEAICDFMANI
jgi:hypothetical protein